MAPPRRINVLVRLCFAEAVPSHHWELAAHRAKYSMPKPSAALMLWISAISCRDQHKLRFGCICFDWPALSRKQATNSRLQRRCSRKQCRPNWHNNSRQTQRIAAGIGLNIWASLGKCFCKRYFVCESGDEPDLVFCDNGKMFDPAKHVCRRILPEDRCPHLGACR